MPLLPLLPSQTIHNTIHYKIEIVRNRKVKYQKIKKKYNTQVFCVKNVNVDKPAYKLLACMGEETNGFE